MLNKFLVLLVVSFTVVSNSFASPFDEMELTEIFNRGYAIEATVSLDRGLMFYAGEVSKSIDQYCVVELHQALDKNVLFKNGHKISLYKVEILQLTYVSDAYLSTWQSSYVNRILTRNKGTTLGSLKSSCRNTFTLKVVDNNELTVIP